MPYWRKTFVVKWRRYFWILFLIYILINKNATGIGAANGSLSGGGNLTDGLVGIEKISL